MNRSLAPAAVVLVALSALSCVGQNAPTPQPLPKDPVALLQLASQVNGLHGDDLKPWHLHATWQTVEKGQVQDQGSYEEWWASEKKFRIAYTATHFHQVLFVTGHGAFFAGDRGVPAVLGIVGQMIKNPMLGEEAISQGKWRFVSHKEGELALTCAANTPGPPLPQLCFADNLPALRLFVTAAESAAWNRFVLFQHRYIGEQVKIVRINQPEVDVSLDQLDLLPNVADADFLPPSTAVSAGESPLVVDQSVIAGFRIGGDRVQYPQTAKALRVQGTVVLHAIIERDGSIGDLKAISGPLMLQQSALVAVRTWRYRPYLLGGEPVQVDTEIHVIYSLGR